MSKPSASFARRRQWLQLACATAIGGAATAASGSTVPLVRNRAGQAWGYIAWWMPDTWRNKLFAELDRALFFGLRMGASGMIAEYNGWPERWQPMRAAFLESPRWPALDLTLTMLVEDDFKTLFASSSSTTRAFATAMALANDPAVSGLHIDFEVYGVLPAAIQQRFREFIVRLATGLHQARPRKSLSVFVPMGSAEPLYDRESLAAVDHVVMQGYDAHWLNSPRAGPVAPLDGTTAVTWRKAVALAQQLGVPRHRVLIGYPLYAYEWPVREGNPRAQTIGSGIETTLAPVPAEVLPLIRVNVDDRVRRYGAQRDPESGSMYYQFQDHNQWRTGWFEGSWSMQQKIAFLESERLAGVAYFVLGYDANSIVASYLERRGPKRKLAPIAASLTGSR